MGIVVRKQLQKLGRNEEENVRETHGVEGRRDTDEVSLKMNENSRPLQAEQPSLISIKPTLMKTTRRRSPTQCYL